MAHPGQFRRTTGPATPLARSLWHHRRVTSATTGTTELLRLLADPLRLRIVELLADEALCTSHLVELTGARQTNIRNHLGLLRDAGLVRTEPCGLFVYNVLVPEGLRLLGSSLDELAARADRDVPRRACP